MADPSPRPSLGAAADASGEAPSEARANPVTIIRNFLGEHSLGHVARLTAEQYLGALVRGFPGFVGIGLRYLLYKVLFRRLGGFCFVYAGARIDHAYGISCGRAMSMNAGAFVSGRGGLTLGDGVLIGPNAVIATTEHRFHGGRPISEQGHDLRPVTIGDDVWIGANAVILAGVTIATGTVVAAGAVVDRDTEPYTIVGGVPARRLAAREGAPPSG